MARNRIIKPEFWADVKVGRLSFGARLLYIGMWNFADDYGTISASPRRLLGDVFENDDTVTLEQVTSWLADIESQGMISRYTAKEKDWYHIVHWNDHQKISHKSTRVNPKPSGDSPETLRQHSGPNVNGNDNDNENGSKERNHGALDPEAELFTKAIAMTGETLTLTAGRRQVIKMIRGDVNAGSPKFLKAVRNMMASNWPNKTLTYFLDKKFDTINRIDYFANSPPNGNGFDKTKNEQPKPLKPLTQTKPHGVKYDSPA